MIFQIKDQGIGIPTADGQQVFEPFHRGRNVSDVPGTGLGLAVVKKLVDIQVGQIIVASEWSRSGYQVYNHAAIRQVFGSKSIYSPDINRPAMKKILVIEDEVQNRDIFLECLEVEGFDAIGAQNSKAAACT